MDEASLAEKSGKSLEEWFGFLDRFTSLGLSEKELNKLLHDNFKFNKLLQSSLIKTYKDYKKASEKYIPSEGIHIISQVVVNLPLSTLCNLWSDRKLRNTWFPMVSYTVLRDNPRKPIQIIWSDSITVVNLKFSRIDKSRSLVEIKHYHLPDLKVASEMSNYWSKILQTLRESVSSELFHNLIIDI